MYSKPRVRSNLINLAKIYMNEAADLLAAEPDDKKPELQQRLELLELEVDLIEGQTGTVLRKLKGWIRILFTKAMKRIKPFYILRRIKCAMIMKKLKYGDHWFHLLTLRKHKIY